MLDRFFHWWAKSTTGAVAFQVCHTTIAYSFVLTCGRQWRYEATAAVLLFSAWKEFWFDIHYETPELSGEWLGGIVDFSTYQLGMILALARFTLLP